MKIQSIRIILLIANLIILKMGFSQDIITKTDSTSIQAKVLEVGIETITFKKTNNLEGPKYICRKSDVAWIKYKNGTVDNFRKNSNLEIAELNYLPKKQFVKDSISVGNYDPRLDFIIIDSIRFSFQQKDKENDLIIDLSFNKNINHENKNGEVFFEFLNDRGNFTIMSSSLREKKYNGDGLFLSKFRFTSPAAKVRYERIMNNPLKTIQIYNDLFEHFIVLTEEQQNAFKIFFANNYQ